MTQGRILSMVSIGLGLIVAVEAVVLVMRMLR